MQVQLVVSFPLRKRFGTCCRSDGVADFSPEMRPIQNAGGVREVPPLFGLDPIGSICYHHDRTCLVWLTVRAAASASVPNCLEGAKVAT